jgi:hypothetical protein
MIYKNETLHNSLEQFVNDGLKILTDFVKSNEDVALIIHSGKQYIGFHS